jgi:hypothetical protein
MDDELKNDIAKMEPEIESEPEQDDEPSEDEPENKECEDCSYQLKITGESTGWIFESSSVPGQNYFVTVKQSESGSYLHCTCPGYRYRKTCKHIRQVTNLSAGGPISI